MLLHSVQYGPIAESMKAPRTGLSAVVVVGTGKRDVVLYMYVFSKRQVWKWIIPAIFVGAGVGTYILKAKTLFTPRFLGEFSFRESKAPRQSPGVEGDFRYYTSRSSIAELYRAAVGEMESRGYHRRVNRDGSFSFFRGGKIKGVLLPGYEYDDDGRAIRAEGSCAFWIAYEDGLWSRIAEAIGLDR